ncbi:MAG TPA: amidohydrolase family protein, partial [Dehalococcoidia bacterium]|nr:amidohydrolase family protein [Dehalococcoidia bacterium]
PPGTWVRAAGYDERALREGRHPTRRELDQAAPGHPVRLDHRSGHATVLNSLGLKLAGITGSTPEPPGGYMERDLADGEPAGLLVEMNEMLDGLLPPPAPGELRSAVAEAARRLLAEGITFLQDATPTNGAAEWRLFGDLQSEGVLPQAVSLMECYDHLGELPEGKGRLLRGPVKIMPKELEHEFYPQAGLLAAILRRIEAAGRRAAVHVTTRAGLETVLEAFEALGRPAPGHRIEHCSVAAEDAARRIAALGLAVVTQPGFLFESADLMLRRLSDADRSDLYPIRRLLEAGVPVAGSSDAPVAAPRPLDGIRGAVERLSRGGAELAPAQSLTASDALALFTSGAARVLGLDRERGSVAPGFVADLVVLNALPGEVPWEQLSVDLTVIAGEVAYERSSSARLD